MIALAVAAHEQQLVLRIAAGLLIQGFDLAGKALPLGLRVVRITLAVGIVSAIDQAEVGLVLFFVSRARKVRIGVCKDSRN